MGDIDSIHKKLNSDQDSRSKVIQSAILIGGMILICVLLIVYGVMLRKAGYMATGDSIDADMALACSSIAKGIYPWNYLTKSDYGKETDVEKEYSLGEQVADTDVVYYADQISANYVNDASGDNDENGTKYNYSEPQQYENDMSIGNFALVEEEYFDNVLFIGDSRTVGISEYGDMDNVTFYGKEGMTVYDMMDCELTTEGAPDTVYDGLIDNDFEKIYIMVGINEIGTGTDEYFIEYYKECIDEIRELQPDAIIVVQSILHVSKEYEDGSLYVKNEAIDSRNNAIKRMCAQNNYAYIDANCIFDVDGALNSELSSDGCHLYAQYYTMWKDFYYNHGIRIKQ